MSDDPVKPINIEDFIRFMARDLDYLQGLAEGLDCMALKNRVSGMRRNLKGLKLYTKDFDDEARD